MAKKESQSPKPDNVSQLPTRCVAEGCSKKSSRLSFCPEHFQWFKEGLINKEGSRPSDFDKKYQAFQSRHKSAA